MSGSNGQAVDARPVGVIGVGYVGLTTAACLAHIGHDVTCVDIDAGRVDRLSRGEIPIYEEGLEELVAEGLAAGRLRFTTSFEAVHDREFAFLCVPTPEAEDGSADLTYVRAAASAIGPHLPADAVVVNKSTVPIGATFEVEGALGRRDLSVVSNPEFLREGTAVSDFLHPDRVVVGGDDQSAAVRVGSLYASLNAPLVVTDPASAELIKYASNAFLATKVSFVNALAAVAEGVGADMSDVVLGMGYDHRIGHEFLRPGPGWGGSCFPKDTSALIHIAEDAGYDFRLLRGVIEVNTQQFERMVDRTAELVGGDLSGRVVAAWGLTFKARTDDLRCSPSMEVLGRIAAAGGKVRAYDPAVTAGREVLPGVEVVGDPVEACRDAEVLVVLTEWDEFRWVDPAEVAAVMARPAVMDTRNLLDRQGLQRHGFEVRSVGRG